MTFPLGRRAAAALVAAAVVGVLTPVSAALAADGVGDVPSVGVQPADPAKDDPNGGQWFLIALAPGESGTVRAKVSNPAKVTQTVSFELRDLTFANDGTPSISAGGTQQDVGSWGGPTQKTFELPPLQSVIVPFKVAVPSDAEPGDHVGAVVAVTANKQGQFRVVRQIATRFYVTVPGEAVRAYSILSVTPHKIGGLFPTSVNTEVVLRNDGRTRVRPKVTVGGKSANGSRLLLSRSVEKYTATTKIPWYGGPVNLSVRAVTDDGTVRTTDKSIFVIPFGLIGSVLAVGLLLFGIYKLIRLRLRRVSSMRSDIERLERLVARQGPAPAAKGSVPAPHADDNDANDNEDEVAALLVAIKRAQRSGSPASVARLALALHDAGGPAAPWLIGALGKVEGRQRDDVIAALRSCDPEVVAGEVRRSDLSPADRDLLLATDATDATGATGDLPVAPPPPAQRRPPADRKAAPAQRKPPKAAAAATPGAAAKLSTKVSTKDAAKVPAKAAPSRRTGSRATAERPEPPAPRHSGDQPKR
jgi:hypothetical protein